jgi:hypothetical protein
LESQVVTVVKLFGSHDSGSLARKKGKHRPRWTVQGCH